MWFIRFYISRLKYINIFNKYIINQTTIYNNNISYIIKVVVCTLVKQENLYIKEFVDYYKELGIKKIILYDNNEIKGEILEDILYEDIINGFVEVINYRGLYKPQKKAYNDCYINYQNDFDWIAFFDVDEFLYLENYTNINKFLSLSKFENCSSILINWKYYGDNNFIYYEPKPIQKRFSKPFTFPNKLINNVFYAASKSIIKTKLNISWAHFPHYLNNSNICRPDGNIVKKPLSPPHYSIAYIKHYATKSTEEYLIKLFKGTVNSNFTFNKNNIIFWLKNYYFLFNKITRKKLLYIKRILKLKI